MDVDKIRERLRKSGKSQSYVAKLAGVSKSSLEKFLRAETKFPHEKTIKKYNDALKKLESKGEDFPPPNHVEFDDPMEYAAHNNKNVVNFKAVARQVDAAFDLITKRGQEMVDLFQDIIHLLNSPMKDEFITSVRNLTFIMTHRKGNAGQPRSNGTEGTQ